MRQVTIEKVVSRDRIRHRAVKRVRTFKAGELVKFNTADGVKMAIVALDKYQNCSECIFCSFGNFSECPRFASSPMQGACLLCDHHRYGYMNMYFKTIDSVLEEL